MAGVDADAVAAALQEILREIQARSAVARSITSSDPAERARAWLNSAKDVPPLHGAVRAALNRHRRIDRRAGPVCSCPGGPKWPCGEYRDIVRAMFGAEVDALWAGESGQG